MKVDNSSVGGFYIPAYITEWLNTAEAWLSRELHAFFPPHLPATETAIYVHLLAAWREWDVVLME